MQINLHNNISHQFNRYDNNSVTIGGRRYSCNILVSHNNIEQLALSAIDEVTLDLINAIHANYHPDLIIFGTGAKIIFPDPKILLSLQRLGVGCETMSIAAMCRTFNYLVSEDRNVVAIILFD